MNVKTREKGRILEGWARKAQYPLSRFSPDFVTGRRPVRRPAAGPAAGPAASLVDTL